MKIRKWPYILVCAALLLSLLTLPISPAARALSTPPLDIDADPPAMQTQTLVDSSHVDEMNWPESATFTLRSYYGSGAMNFGDQLDANQRAVYDQLVSLAPSTAAITINLQSPVQNAEALYAAVQPAIDAALYDCPELFWLKLGPGGCTFSFPSEGEIAEFTFKVVSQYANAASLRQQITDAVATFPVSGNTPYERVRAIHDGLCGKVSYATGDLSTPAYHNVVGPLLNHVAVCEGYAKAFKLLCDREGIPCMLVSGSSVTSAGGGPHMWNIVQLGGEWYAVDTTWDDQTTAENPARIVYDFFLAGSGTPQSNFTPAGAIFSQTHLERGDLSGTGLKTFTYPAIAASAYAYTPAAFTLIRQSEDKDAVRGAQAAFSVIAAGGTPPYAYNWEVDKGSGFESAAAVGSGADTDTLTTISATADMNGWRFRCAVSDSVGSRLTSDAAALWVTEAASALMIVSHPADAAVDLGRGAEFSVNVRGGTAAYTYRWQVKRDSDSSWVDVTGVDGAGAESFVTVPATEAMNGYRYRCVITDSSPTPQSVTTNAATLSLYSAPTPLTIRAQPGNATVTEPQKAVFSIEAAGGTPIYVYQWQRKTGDGWVNVTAQDGTGGNTASFITVGTTMEMSGTQYRCLLRDSANSNLTSEAATLTVNRASTLYIAAQPVDALVEPGAKPGFTVDARGGIAPYTYAWQIKKGTADWANVTAQDGTASGAGFTGAPATLEMNGYQLRCTVTDASGAATMTRAAQLLVAKGKDPGKENNGGDQAGGDAGGNGFWDWISRLLGFEEDAGEDGTGTGTGDDAQNVENTDYATFGPNGAGMGTTASGSDAIAAAYGANGAGGARGGSALQPSMPIQIGPATVQSVTENSVYIAFEATGLNTPLSYQWWVQVAPGSYEMIPGAMSPNLSETEFLPGTRYVVRCIVRDSRGFGVISPDVGFTTANPAVPAGQVKTGKDSLPETRTGTINGNRVNVRATASTKGKKLGSCNQGNPVVVMGPAVNGFYPIQWTNSSEHAYVYARYVTLR